MKPITDSEKMMFSTVRIQTSDGGSGTGFFFAFDFDRKYCPIIVTNKHVVNFNPDETVTFMLHLESDNGESNESIMIRFETKWIFHLTHDLCFCFANPLFEEITSRTSKKVFIIPITENIIGTQDKLDELSAIEELVMVGYPIGLWDKLNNYPIFRRGYTASHPAFDFNEKGVGLVDMACFPGSSGSPIFTYNNNGYSDKKGSVFLGRSRIILLGILFSGPIYNAAGDIIEQEIPTHNKVSASTPVMVNLGFYVKAFEILEFRKMIFALLP